jgi:hypothetical protein
MFAGKKVCICGYGDVGNGSAQSMKTQGAMVCVTEADPIWALQACMEGIEVERLEGIIDKCDKRTSTTHAEDEVCYYQFSEHSATCFRLICFVVHRRNGDLYLGRDELHVLALLDAESSAHIDDDSVDAAMASRRWRR